MTQRPPQSDVRRHAGEAFLAQGDGRGAVASLRCRAHRRDPCVNVVGSRLDGSGELASRRVRIALVAREHTQQEMSRCESRLQREHARVDVPRARSIGPLMRPHSLLPHRGESRRGDRAFRRGVSCIAQGGQRRDEFVRARQIPDPPAAASASKPPLSRSRARGGTQGADLRQRLARPCRRARQHRGRRALSPPQNRDADLSGRPSPLHRPAPRRYRAPAARRSPASIRISAAAMLPRLRVRARRNRSRRPEALRQCAAGFPPCAGAKPTAPARRTSPCIARHRLAPARWPPEHLPAPPRARRGAAPRARRPQSGVSMPPRTGPASPTPPSAQP